MYTHNLLTSASWKQEHNTPLTARPSDINSSSLHFEQGWGGGRQGGYGGRRRLGGGGGGGGGAEVQGRERVHIHRRTEDGGWRGGPQVQGFVLRIWSSFAEKYDQTHGHCHPTPQNTVEV